jgi:hypothetical protein
MMTNPEFLNKYGYRNPRLFRQYAEELIKSWNSSVNNRDGRYTYTLLD